MSTAPPDGILIKMCTDAIAAMSAPRACTQRMPLCDEASEVLMRFIASVRFETINVEADYTIALATLTNVNI